MEPDGRHRQISDIYHAALARNPAEREAFVRNACDGDEALRREVESLLQYESQSSGFLESPAAVMAGALQGAPGGDAMVGRQLGPYTIVAPLGAGGMGEVYRARDTKLGRDVAIKILPSHFTNDPERRARFAREARTLATLNHPHIGAIYGLEESDGLSALVLELVEGQTLAERLERGPLKIAVALAIARQIADTRPRERDRPSRFEARQRRVAGIIRGTGDVRAKVLDFGLAKPVAVDLADSPPPSGSFHGTADGRILGTPAYMSPEQARGLTVDKRTDIWAFGCVLFEMLTGRRAFEGATITDTLAQVLEREPDWTRLPAQTPPSIRALLDRCCARIPGGGCTTSLMRSSRWTTLRDWTLPPVLPPTSRAADPRRNRQRLTWIAAGILAGVADLAAMARGQGRGHARSAVQRRRPEARTHREARELRVDVRGWRWRGAASSRRVRSHRPCRRVLHWSRGVRAHHRTD